MAASLAVVQPTSGAPRLPVAAGGASQAIGPAQLRQVVAARGVRGEALFEFQQRARVVLHDHTHYTLR